MDSTTLRFNRCTLIEQGFEIGSCLTDVSGRSERACIAMKFDRIYYRLIKSITLSRPED